MDESRLATEYADAHIHLFETGFGAGFTQRNGVSIDEAACYADLAADYRITTALVVGAEVAPWAAGNNDYLAQIVPTLPWARAVAYVAPDADVTIETLEAFAKAGFVGLAVYTIEAAAADLVVKWPVSVWQWLESHRWLVSVNARGAAWSRWQEVVARHPELTLLISHLGLPPAQATPPTASIARNLMGEVATFARYPRCAVKLSGFYALSDPGWAYPHRAAWPYVDVVLDAFGDRRLLWASDFSPHLDLVSFPQTFGVLSQIPSLADMDLTAIYGGNLLRLIGDVADAS